METWNKSSSGTDSGKIQELDTKLELVFGDGRNVGRIGPGFVTIMGPTTDFFQDLCIESLYSCVD